MEKEEGMRGETEIRDGADSDATGRSCISDVVNAASRRLGEHPKCPRLMQAGTARHAPSIPAPLIASGSLVYCSATVFNPPPTNTCLIRSHIIISPYYRRHKVGAVVFGRPFVKRFALCYRTVVCLSLCR